MKTRTFTVAFLAIIAVAAIAAAFGHPVMPPEAIASLGMFPLVTGEITTSDIAEMVRKQGTELATWRKEHDAKISAIDSEITEIAKKANRPNAGNAAATSGEVKHLFTVDGDKLPLLAKNQRYADVCNDKDVGSFSLAEYCRDIVIGSRKAASGAALVPTYIGAQIIDAIRARTVLVEAGAGSIIIDGPTNLARITTSPTVHLHTEGETDISESDVVATAVALNPKVLAVLIPLTTELVQDSPNLDAVLNMALAQAFAAKVDALGLAALLADAGIPESEAGQDPAIWAKVLEAVGSALALNQGIPHAHISAPADFIARAAQLASTAGSWLGKPPALAGMAELQTSVLTAGTALFGNFAEAFALAVRSDLRVEVVRHAKPTSGSHLLVAHCRIGGIVLQPGKLYRQLKTVA